MEAIIAHPAKGAKRSPARKTAAPAPQSSTPDKQASWKPVELKPTALHEAAAFIKQSVANCNAEVWAMADSDSGDDLEMGLANLMTWLDRKIDVEGLEFGVDPVAAFSLLQQDIRSVISVLRCALSYRQLPELVDVVGALENSVGAAMDIELALRNGAKPFRDRPTPPIRRVERSDDELKDTPVHEAGRTGKLLALQCTWDISVVAEEVAKMGDWIVEADSPATLEGLLRCYGLRIQALNGQVMAYLDGDGTTAGEMHREIFKGTRPFRGEEE